MIFFLGCFAPKEPAPEDLEGLTRYLFRNWEDPALVQEGMENLGLWLKSDGQEETAQEDGYILEALDEEVLTGIEYDLRVPLSSMVGAAVTRNSLYSIDEHAVVIVEEDQRWNAPSKYEQYDRIITQGSAEAFISSEAHLIPEFIFTENDVVQERLGVRIPYILYKNYRWTHLDDGSRALIARSWVSEPGCSGEDGESGNCLEISFSVDVLYEYQDSSIIRMTASWNYLSLILELPYDFQIDQLVKGIGDVDDATDDRLEELYGPRE